ncbi:MAG: serine hydrolase domain-containing protein [Blastocatellia bacterium]
MKSTIKTLSMMLTVRALVVALAAALVMPASAQNQSTPAIPDTAVGKLAGSLIVAINTGDREKIKSFLTANLSDNALREDSAEGLAGDLQSLYRQTGGLDVMEIIPSKEPNTVRFKLRSKRGNHWARLVTRLDKDQPARLDGWGLRQTLDPETEKAEAWPEGKVSEADAIKEIERHAASAASRDHFSGVVLVAKGDRVLFHNAYGHAEKNFCGPNKLDTKFNLGSMNKMFTSVAIAQLVQAGKLSYDDTLAKVLPDYPNKPIAEKITIHHLLTHTSGLGDFFKAEFFKNREKYVALKEYLPIFANDALQFEPGKSWSYSNAAFIVLGVVVEKVSGEDYFDYVREHIYKPAGMTDSDSFRRNDIVPNLSYGYTRFSGNDPLGIEPRKINWMELPLRGSSAGGGYSTAPDLLKFAQALRGYKLVNKELTEKVTGAKVDTRFSPDIKYGYGFIEEQMSGHSVRGHGGGAPGINSDLKMFWDGSYTVVVMGNYDPPAAQDLCQKIAQFLGRQ